MTDPSRSSSGRLGSGRCARRVLAVAVAVLGIALGAPTAAEAGSDAPPRGRVFAPGLQFLTAAPAPAGPLASGTAVTSAGMAVAGTGTSPVPANTDFVLHFDGTVDAATREVVTAAAGVWSDVLVTRVPIVVDVRMEALAPGLLGAAGPTTAHFGRPAFPRPDVLYPVALANQFAGTDLDPRLADIDLLLSSSMQWDKSVDGDISSPTAQSMLSVAIHELGHGLGHTSWARRSATGWVVNYLVEGVTVALAYDRLVASGSGALITSADESSLGAVLTAPLHWTGPRGRTAVGGTRPKLYSPSVFDEGSSIGHLDEATFGKGVMTPFLAPGESHTSVPALTRAMMADTGWPVTTPGSTSTTTAPTTPSAPPTATVSAPSTVEGRAEAFVDSVSHDFLGRPASDEERVRWRDHLLAGGPRSTVTQAFAYSDEWIGVIVDGLYRSTLGRGPDAGGRAHWIDVIRSGATPAEVAARFYASDEYFRRSGGTTTAWVGDLYSEILGRRPDAAGLAFWVGRTAEVPRAGIAFDFHQSLESRRDRVAALFERLLGRAPDAHGWGYWAGILTNGRDVDLAVFLAASDEYFGRAASRTA